MIDSHNDRYNDFEDDDFEDDQFDREITRIPQRTPNKVLGKSILEQANQYWQEKITGKDRMLGPQAIPLFLQYAQVVQIIKGAHKGRNNRNQ